MHLIISKKGKGKKRKIRTVIIQAHMSKGVKLYNLYKIMTLEAKVRYRRRINHIEN